MNAQNWPTNGGTKIMSTLASWTGKLYTAKDHCYFQGHYLMIMHEMVKRIYRPIILIELRHGEVLGSTMLQYTHHK